MKKVQVHFEKHMGKYLWWMLWTALIFKVCLLLLISLWYFRWWVQQQIFAEESAINFFTITWVELDTEYFSNTWTLIDFASGVVLTVSGCDYRINTWNWMNISWMVYSWNQIVLKNISSNSYGSVVSCPIIIWEYETSFDIVTKDEIVRDSLIFEIITWMDLWIEYFSETWLILEWSGVVASISSGFYSVNTGERLTWNVVMNSWDYFHMKLLSSNQFDTSNISILSLDDLDLYFEVKTKNEPVDDLINSFVFVFQTGTDLDTYIESEIVPILWINTGIVLNVSGLEYSLNGDTREIATWLVFDWDVIQVRILSSNVYNFITSGTLSFWDIRTIYQVETMNEIFVWDDSPDILTFENIIDAELDSPYPTSLFEISGINTGISIYVENGYYRINDGDRLVETGMIYNGDMAQILVISSNVYTSSKAWILLLWGISYEYEVTTKDEPIIVVPNISFSNTWIVDTWVLDILAPEISWFVMTWTVSWLNISFSSDEESLYSFSYLIQTGTNFIIYSGSEFATGHSFDLSWFVTWFVYNYALSLEDLTWNVFNQVGQFIFDMEYLVRHSLEQFTEDELVHGATENVSVIQLLKLEIEKYNTCKESIDFFSEQYDVEDILLTVKIPVFKDMFLSTVIDVFTSLVINTLWTQLHLSEDEMNDVVRKYEHFATVLKIVRDSDDICEHSLSNYHITMFQKSLEKYGIFLDGDEK